jgi:outer membrane protein assembly factor BamB
MANYQKLQVSTALNIYKSDNANIPFANVVVAGTSDAAALNELEDNTVDFIALNVQIGDVVYNTTTGTAATVTAITNTILLLNANLFSASGNYIIYAQNNKEACVLYIGTGGNLRVLTASGQDVLFTGLLGGTFLPVQVLKVFATGTTASNLVALW